MLTLTSFMAAAIAMQYKTQTVLMAAGTTALVVITVTLFTFYSKFDITKAIWIICLMPFGMLFVWIFFFIPGVNVSGNVRNIFFVKVHVIPPTTFSRDQIKEGTSNKATHFSFLKKFW